MPGTVTGGHKDEQNRVPAFQELSPEDGQTLCPGPSPALPQVQVRFWDRPRWTAPSPGACGGAAADPAPGCFSGPLCLECGKIPTGSGLGGSWAAAWLPRELTRKGYLPFISILCVSISLDYVSILPYLPKAYQSIHVVTYMSNSPHCGCSKTASYPCSLTSSVFSLHLDLPCAFPQGHLGCSLSLLFPLIFCIKSY